MHTISPATQNVASVGHRHRSPIEEQVRENLSVDYDRMRNYLRGRVRTAEDADDLLQDYCAKVLHRSGQIRQREAILGWMAKVMRTALIDYYRRSAVERRHREIIAASEAPSEELGGPHDCPYLGAAVPMLKPEYADLVSRIDVSGEVRAEAAEALGISVNALTVRLFRARTALRKKLLGFCQNDCTRYGTTCSFVRVTDRVKSKVATKRLSAWCKEVAAPASSIAVESRAGRDPSAECFSAE